MRLALALLPFGSGNSFTVPAKALLTRIVSLTVATLRVKENLALSFLSLGAGYLAAAPAGPACGGTAGGTGRPESSRIILASDGTPAELTRKSCSTRAARRWGWPAS